MSDKRLMIVGLDGSGKSSIADLVEGVKTTHQPRQDLYYRSKCFEVPGSYIENHWLNNIMLMLAYNQATAAVFLLDGKTGLSLYSPGYAKAFTIPVLGVLTKAETLSSEARSEGFAKLKAAGCDTCQALSLSTGEGLNEFSHWLQANALVSLENIDERGGDR